MGSGGGGDVVVGYWYYMDVLLTFAHGPIDEIVEIQGGERVAWTGSVTANGQIDILQGNLFGGEEREGGWTGTVDVMLGGATQTTPAKLSASLATSGALGVSPAYRGVMSMFFGGYLSQIGFAWSAINPYFKPPKVKLRRYPKWYPAKARIGNDANPVHIIYECLTNASWGLGYPINDLDDVRFKAAADVLFTENFGISLSWNQTSTIEDFVASILRHFNGALNQDRTTGQLFLSVIRDDYDVGTLPVLSPSNCNLESLGRAGAGEIVNEVTLKYTRIDNGELDAVTVQDLASIQNQGRVISQEIELPGIRDPDMAARVAQRELQSRSRGLAKVSITATRAAYGIYEGDVFVLNWPDLGISGLACRVAVMDVGDLESATIRIEAVEDVFGLPSVSYVTSPPVGWVDNSGVALPATVQRAVEVPYYSVVKRTSSSDRNDYAAEFGFGMLLAKTPQLSSSNYEMRESPNSSTYTAIGNGNWTPHCTLVTTVDYSATVLSISGPSLFSQIAAGGLVYVGEEIMELVSFSDTAITVRRGVLDSLPQSHTAGASIFILADGLAGYDAEVRVSGEQVFYKALTRCPGSVLAIGSATAVSITLDNRFARPYPPGNVKIAGSYFPTTVTASNNVVVTWAHRDRTLQTVSPLSAWTAGNIGPEPGVTYTVRVYNSSNALVETQTGLSVTTATIRPGPTVYSGQHRVEVESVRDGLTSRVFSHTFTLV